jgi:hypothetical protein
MHSETAAAALRDIAHHIGLAGQFTVGFDYDTFRDDPRTVYAVTRCLEIISEASRRLPDELKARHPAADLPKPSSAAPTLPPLSAHACACRVAHLRRARGPSLPARGARAGVRGNFRSHRQADLRPTGLASALVVPHWTIRISVGCGSSNKRRSADGGSGHGD